MRKGSPSSQPLQGAASESHAEISPQGEEKTTHSVPRQRRCLQPLIIAAVYQEGKPDSTAPATRLLPSQPAPSPLPGVGKAQTSHYQLLAERRKGADGLRGNSDSEAASSLAAIQTQMLRGVSGCPGFCHSTNLRASVAPVARLLKWQKWCTGIPLARFRGAPVPPQDKTAQKNPPCGSLSPLLPAELAGCFGIPALEETRRRERAVLGTKMWMRAGFGHF